MENIEVSIITVCLNAEQTIMDTIESVLRLEGLNFEYIVKDGGSQDKTNHIIESYHRKFEAKEIPFIHIVRPDKGIYEGMNQAAEYCQGSWINFMNAGDTFYNPYVITDIFNKTIPKEAGVLYGHTLFKVSKNLSFISNHSLKEIEKEMPFCHQSTFIRKEIFNRYKFDCGFQLLADYNLFLSLYKAGIKFVNVNAVVSIFICDGISFVKADEVNKEKRILRKRYHMDSLPERCRCIAQLKRIINSKCPVIGNFFFCYKQMKRISKNIR